MITLSKTSVVLVIYIIIVISRCQWRIMRMPVVVSIIDMVTV